MPFCKEMGHGKSGEKICLSLSLMNTSPCFDTCVIQSCDSCKRQVPLNRWSRNKCGTKHSNRYSNGARKYHIKTLIMNKKSHLKVLTKREPAPYGHCTSDWEKTLEGMDGYGRRMIERLFGFLGYGPPYSQDVCTTIELKWLKCVPQLCLKNCFFLAFVEEAKCANNEVASVPDQQKKIADHICDLTAEGIN